jgi:NADPH:quinone reductase-like Zn-dependent oxidoreductase
MALMKAAVQRRYGGPELVRIEDFEKPVPRDNEVLVRIHATTVCAADWRVRSANPFIVRIVGGFTRPRKPTILGMEMSGIVESTGKNVTRFRAGDQVFALTKKMGGHAEYACLTEDALEIKPSNMSFEESAAVLFGGLTAVAFLRKAKIEAGQKVLVYGASGSVGVFAVQLAKHFGAHVTAVCSGANLNLVKSLGADEAVDNTKEDFSKAGRVYDIVFDTVGYSGFWRSMRSLKRGGRYVMIAPRLGPWLLGGLWASLTGAGKVIGLIAAPKPDDRPFLKELIEAEKLRTVIDRLCSFDQIAEAHRHAEAGHKKGHVVVVIDGAYSAASTSSA